MTQRSLSPPPVLQSLHANQLGFRVRDGLLLVAGLFIGQLLLGRAMSEGMLRASTALLVALTACVQVLVVAALIVLAYHRRVSLRDLLLGKHSWRMETAWGLAVALVFWGLAIALWLAEAAPIGDSLGQTMEQTSLAVRLAFFAAAVGLAPLSEELLYRGTLQTSLAVRVGVVPACLLQAAFFALMHPRGPQVMAIIFVGGVGYGMLALWRGCLLPGIVAHATFNAVAVGWLFTLVWFNAHQSAGTMAEAAQDPAWWNEPPQMPIPDHSTAREQYEAALWVYGSQGLQLRKVQVQAFAKVLRRFPGDPHYRALSLLGIQEVYLRYLNDPRRAIVTGHRLLAETPDQREILARGVLSMVHAYLELDQTEQARHWLERATADYGHLDGMAERLRGFRQAIEQRDPL